MAKLRALSFSLLLFSLLPHAPAICQELDVGIVHRKVLCKEAENQSYALYIPSSYKADMPCALLLGFSPSANGLQSVESYREAAERFGWIVAASNNSRNGSMAPNQKAARTMWDDVHSRLNIDAKRIYTAGFSGGACVATWCTQGAPGPLAGVFMHARGDLSLLPKKAQGERFVLAPGRSDFNLSESIRFLVQARAQGHDAILALQSGGHAWAQPAECALMLLDAEVYRRLALKEPATEAKETTRIALELMGALEEKATGPTFFLEWQRMTSLAERAAQHPAGKSLAKRLKTWSADQEKGRIESEVQAWNTLAEKCMFDRSLFGRYPSAESLKSADRARRELLEKHTGTTAAHLALLAQLNEGTSLRRAFGAKLDPELKAQFEAYISTSRTWSTDFIERAEELVRARRYAAAITALHHGVALGTTTAEVLKRSGLRKLRRRDGYAQLEAAVEKGSASQVPPRR